MKEPVKYLCGCALSTKFPYCDGSQLVARGRDPRKLQRCGTAAATAVVADAEPPKPLPRKTPVSA